MGSNNFFIFLFILVYSTFACADNKLVKENNNIFFKQGNAKIFLFTDENYCFDKDAFSIENLTNDNKRYLFVNHTDDCNSGGKYEIFDISENKAKKFYLSPLYDPEFDINEYKIIERLNDGAVGYTRIYVLKNGKYLLSEELKTLDSDLNLSKVYSGGLFKMYLKNNSNQVVKNLEISANKAYFFNNELKKTKSYIIRGDKVKIDGLIENNNLIYINVEFKGLGKITKGYIKLSDVL